MGVIYYLSYFIGMAGVAILTWGTILSFIQFVLLEAKGAGGETVCRKREYVRHHLGGYILMGMEFFIVADLIRTVTKPTLRELAVLGSIVTIRTVTSYFLNKEMAQSHQCEK